MEAEAARVAQFGEPRGRDCYLRHGEDGTPITTLLVGAGLAYELTGLRPECL